MNPKYVDPTKQHFVAVEGASSLAKHFLAGANVSFSKTVQSIARLHSPDCDDGASAAVAAAAAPTAPQWTISTAGGDATEVFDGVVLTAPMPQVLALGGDVQALITAAGVRSKLEASQRGNPFLPRICSRTLMDRLGRGRGEAQSISDLSMR